MVLVLCLQLAPVGPGLTATTEKPSRAAQELLLVTPSPLDSLPLSSHDSGAPTVLSHQADGIQILSQDGLESSVVPSFQSFHSIYLRPTFGMIPLKNSPSMGGSNLVNLCDVATKIMWF